MTHSPVGVLDEGLAWFYFITAPSESVFHLEVAESTRAVKE